MDVPVMLTINTPPPVISLDPATINVFAYEGDAVPDFAIDVTNIGGGVLDWTAANNAGWATIDPTSGIGDGTLTVSIDITGLDPEVVYRDTVFVDDPAALNTPEYTIINLTIFETDHVEVETVTTVPGDQVEVGIYYTNATPTGQFTLPLSFVNTDVFCDSVSFQGTRMVIPDESVVTIDNAAGTIEIFGFTINGNILPAGNGLIARMFFTVAGDAATQFVPIDTAFIAPDGEFEFTYYMGGPKTTLFTSGGIDISDTPCFDFPTDTVAFEFDLGDILPTISFPVNNTCGGILEWSVTAGASWLVLTPASGTEADLVTFGVDTTGMAPGSYVTTATFESNGENTPYDVVVTLNLTGVPILSVAPLMFDIGQVCGGEIASGEFDIMNIGYETLDWTADALETVALSAYAGTAPSTITFDITTSLLDYGHHSLEVTITSDGALHSPQAVMIELFVVNCDECTFDIAEVEGAQGIPVGVPVYTTGIENVAGLQFNIGYDPALVMPDSVTSAHMSGPVIGYVDDQIHYIWDDIVNPITVASGEAVMTLWVTPLGDVGQENCFEWAGVNEITDPYGIPYEGVIYCGGCLMTVSPFMNLSGTIIYHYDPFVVDTALPIGVPDVMVEVSGDASHMTMTDVNGNFEFSNMMPGNYMITPLRTEDDPGVSIADAIKIERHLAFVEEFESPHQMIAADVNLSDGVTVADVVIIRRYLAELDVLPSGNWIFVDANFAISKDNWYEAPHWCDVTIINDDIDMLYFIGMRMGDVNWTWSAPKLSPKMANVELTIPDVIATPNDQVMVPIVVTNFSNVAGVEVHITYDMAQVSVDSIASQVLPGPTVNAVDGRAHIIWGDFENPLTLADGETLAVIYFQIMPTASGDLPLEFMASCELTDEIGNPYALTLTGGKLMVEPLDVDDDHANLPLQFELRQNYPNPFNPSTTISYTVAKAMSLSLEVYNVSGQVVDRIDLGRKTAGAYSFTYNGNKLASGIYTYRLVGEGISVAKQMLLVK
jgi:hypothetical protein